MKSLYKAFPELFKGEAEFVVMSILTELATSCATSDK